MHAGEEDLLERLVGLLERRVEVGWLKVPALFVDRHGVDGVLDVRSELDVVIVGRGDGLERQADRQPERADGVPHADALDRGVVFDGVRLPELPGARVVGAQAAAIERLGLGIELDAVAAQDAAAADHAADAARGERAAAEAEQIDGVARLVVGDEESVDIVDIGVKALAERPPFELVEHVAGADALVVVDDLLRAGGGALGRAAGDLQHVGNAQLARVFVLLLIGSIELALAPVESAHDRHRVQPTRRTAYPIDRPLPLLRVECA